MFGGLKATGPLLEFLATTAVGCPRGEAALEAQRAQQDEEWGMDVLEEGEREGEG